MIRPTQFIVYVVFSFRGESHVNGAGILIETFELTQLGRPCNMDVAKPVSTASKLSSFSSTPVRFSVEFISVVMLQLHDQG